MILGFRLTKSETDDRNQVVLKVICHDLLLDIKYYVEESRYFS